MADPFKPHDTKENPTAFAQGKDPRFPQVSKETLSVPKANQPASFTTSVDHPPQVAVEQPLSVEEQKAKKDFDELQAKARANAEAQTKVAQERKVKVKLLNDVWIEDPGHEDAGKDGIRRVKTNVPVLDGNGNATVDPKTRAPITTHTIVELPLSVAKMMIDAGKAERMDPL